MSVSFTVCQTGSLTNGHGSKLRTPSEHPNPDSNRLHWVVHLPQNGTIGSDPLPNGDSDEGTLLDSFRPFIPG